MIGLRFNRIQKQEQKQKIILLYDNHYINKEIYHRAVNNNEDFMLCVANERIEEIIQFSRHDLLHIPIQEIDEFDYMIDKNDIVFVRGNLESIIKECDDCEQTEDDKSLWEYVKDTYLYTRGLDAQNNIEHWWRFIPPRYRNIVEFKLSEIYEKNKDNFPDHLKEILFNPVFIKTVRKRPIVKISSWVGANYIDALGYSTETIPLDAELIASPRINKPFKEYRVWVINDDNYKKVLNISEYKDQYYQNSIEDNYDELGAILFVENYVLKHKNIDKFPKLFVVDVFCFYEDEDDSFDNETFRRYDIVEFNAYELSGRYIGNSINSIINTFKEIRDKGVSNVSK